jgi:hypothetical protein
MGTKLYLVEHDESPQGLERQERGREPCDVTRILEIEDVNPLSCRSDRTCQGGLADLSCPEEGDDRRLAQQVLDPCSVGVSSQDPHT